MIVASLSNNSYRQDRNKSFRHFSFRLSSKDSSFKIQRNFIAFIMIETTLSYCPLQYNRIVKCRPVLFISEPVLCSTSKPSSLELERNSTSPFRHSSSHSSNDCNPCCFTGVDELSVIVFLVIKSTARNQKIQTKTCVKDKSFVKTMTPKNVSSNNRKNQMDSTVAFLNNMMIASENPRNIPWLSTTNQNTKKSPSTRVSDVVSIIDEVLDILDEPFDDEKEFFGSQ